MTARSWTAWISRTHACWRRVAMAVCCPQWTAALCCSLLRTEGMVMTLLIANREAWLGRLTTCVGPRFSDAGYPLPPEVRVSVGWPKPGGGGMRHQELQG